MAILIGDFVWFKIPTREEPIRCKVIDVGYGGVANSEYCRLKITGCKGRFQHGCEFDAPIQFVFPRKQGE